MIIIEVFTRPGCPHCPPTYQFIKQFAQKNKLTLKHINTATTEGQLLSSKLGVMAVPTIFIHSDIHPQRIGFRGKPSENDLNKALEVVKQTPQEEKPKQ
jgi:glutaredoxin